jgi:hypothetical protein
VEAVTPRRVVAVLARPAGGQAAGLVDAMLADVIDLITDTDLVQPAIVVPAGIDVSAQTAQWPQLDVVPVVADPTVSEALVAVAAPGVNAAAVVAADVPDLPALLLGKLFSAMSGQRGAAAAVCPAEGGGLVAVAAMAPISPWLSETTTRLDDVDALERLREAAPLTELSVGPGWHRIRTPADLARLDPGLEGWEATRRWRESSY